MVYQHLHVVILSHLEAIQYVEPIVELTINNTKERLNIWFEVNEIKRKNVQSIHDIFSVKLKSVYFFLILINLVISNIVKKYYMLHKESLTVCL